MWLNTREPHGPHGEPALHARRWEEVENLKLANDVVRFVLHETATWRQERRAGDYNVRNEMVGGWPAGRTINRTGRPLQQKGSEGQVRVQGSGSGGRRLDIQHQSRH